MTNAVENGGGVEGSRLKGLFRIGKKADPVAAAEQVTDMMYEQVVDNEGTKNIFRLNLLNWMKKTGVANQTDEI